MWQVPGSKQFGMGDGSALAHTMMCTFPVGSKSPFITFGCSIDISATRYPLPAMSLFFTSGREARIERG